MVKPGPESEPGPEPEPEPEPQHRSLLVQSKPPQPPASNSNSNSNGNGVSFAADTKENDGPRHSGVVRMAGRVCGKAFVNTLTQAGGVIMLGALVVLCIRAWSGTMFLWEGSLDEAWSKTHSWLPKNPYRGPLVRPGWHIYTFRWAFCCFLSSTVLFDCITQPTLKTKTGMTMSLFL
jgi:hypothetical protein